MTETLNAQDNTCERHHFVWTWPIEGGSGSVGVCDLCGAVTTADRDAAIRAEAWAGAGDDTGAEGTIPTPPQLLRRMAEATAEERLAWAERAIVNSEKAHQCFMQDHRGQIAHLKRRLQDAEDRLSTTTEEPTDD